MLHPALSKTAVCEFSWDLRRPSWAEFVPLLLRSKTSMTAFSMSSTLLPLCQVCSDQNIFLYFHSFPIFLPVTANFGRVKNEIAMMTDSLPSLQFSEVFTRSALPHSRPGYYMQCRLLTVSPFWLKFSYREYALVKGSLKDKQVTKKRNLCKSRNYCVDMGWMACALACGMSDHLMIISSPSHCTGLC